jgi:hypothetical protein
MQGIITGDDGDASARASPLESRLRWNPAETTRLASPPELRLMAVRRQRRASEGLRGQPVTAVECRNPFFTGARMRSGTASALAS